MTKHNIRIRVVLLTWMACVMACCLFLVYPPVAEGARAAVHPRVVSAEVKGLVMYADGRTPAKRVPIRVWDMSEREFIAETETNENGVYKLPRLDAGEYFITYDWTKLRVSVVGNGSVSSQQPHDIIIVIPRDVGAVSITHLSAILLSSTITEQARRMGEDDTPRVVSP